MVEDRNLGVLMERLFVVGDANRRRAYRDEGDEIWWGGEGLGLQGCVAHFFDDGGKEDGEAGEGDVGAEEHQGC